MLTPRQSHLLAYIDAKIREDGYCPTFEEMAKAIGLRSKTGIDRLLTGLVERGFVRRKRYRARAIEVLRGPMKEGRQ